MTDTQNIVDLTMAIDDPFSMPLCPICDQPLEEYEAITLFKAHGCIALAHVYCIADARKEAGV